MQRRPPQVRLLRHLRGIRGCRVRRSRLAVLRFQEFQEDLSDLESQAPHLAPTSGQRGRSRCRHEKVINTALTRYISYATRITLITLILDFAVVMF